MTDSSSHFIPLSTDSQGDSENVLFYNKAASLEAIYHCATGRIKAAMNLFVNLYEFRNSDPSMLCAMSLVATLLLNDAYSLMEEFDPQALKERVLKGEL